MQLITILGLAAAVAVAKPTVYLIRHGEKPDDGDGLSAQGVQRAQCLRSVFGANSDFNIGHIMAQTPKSSGKRQRPYDTVKPLADDLGMAVDTSCDRDDPNWEHKALTDIVEKLGDDNAPDYPSDHFDLIWVDQPPYNKINSVLTENCPGI